MIGNIIHHPRQRVKWHKYRGWVYDLQVDEDHSFVAGGVIAHNCYMLPITPTFAELGFEGMEETGADTWLPDGAGEAWFRGLDEAAQRDMMGPGRYDAWQAGQFDFSQLSRAVHDRDWGRTFVETPLKDLIGAG